jgi:hypothetical protein
VVTLKAFSALSFSFILALLTFVSPASASETLLYADGAYRGNCDTLFFEHVYRDHQMVGVRQAHQFQRSELVISSVFNTQTLAYTHEQRSPNGQIFEPLKTTNVVNQMGEGLWRETGGKGKNTWTWDWKKTDDGTFWNQSRSARNYTVESWQMVTEDRIFMYHFEKIKPGASRKVKEGSLNISMRMICTFDRI